MGVCSLARIRKSSCGTVRSRNSPRSRAASRRLAPDDHRRTLAQPAERLHQQADEHLHKRLAHNGHRRCLNLHKAAIAEPLAPGNSGLVLLVEDLTETQQLEDRLVPPTPGEHWPPGAGVAHEIGNPITGIACLAQNLRDEREGDGEIVEISGQIIEQTKRVSRIVQSLMSFAHAGERQHQLYPVSLAQVTQDAIGCSRSTATAPCGSSTSAIRRTSPRAIHSGRRSDRPAIQRPRRVAAGSIHISSEVAEQTVYLTVEDEGSGIPKDIQDRCSSHSSPPRTLAKAPAGPRAGLFDH